MEFMRTAFHGNAINYSNIIKNEVFLSRFQATNMHCMKDKSNIFTYLLPKLKKIYLWCKNAVISGNVADYSNMADNFVYQSYAISYVSKLLLSQFQQLTCPPI